MSDAEFVPGVGDLERIGRGATASVFRGRDLSTGRTVVAKVLNVRLLTRDEIDRFDDTLESVEQLPRNGSLLDVVGHGVNSSGHPWLITADVPRQLAAELAAHGTVPWADAIAATTQIAQSLGEAHRRGIIHGDITPNDIRIDEHGLPLLADLGLLDYANGGPSNRGNDARREHTAPEVLDGAPRDERTDVYALASVLYEMISGAPPFGRAAAQSPEQLDARIRTESPATLTHHGVPIPVDDVIRRALSKHLDDRPVTAASLADALSTAMRTTRVFGDTSGVPASLAPVNPAPVTAPLSPDDPTPVNNPYPDDIPVLPADEAAPLLAAAGRRERRRRRERRALLVVLALGVIAGVVTAIVALARSDDNTSARIAASSGVGATDDTTAGISGLEPRPVAADGYPFTATFDTAARSAELSGVASPIGEARLKQALTPVGRVVNNLEVRNGPEPDDGAAVIDAITLIAAMRRTLSAGALSFDGQTFSVSGFTLSPGAEQELRDVIALMPTPVDRPQLSPDPNSVGPSSTAAPTGPSGPKIIAVSARPAAFTVAADGRFHIVPVTLVPAGSATTSLCLASRTVKGPVDGDLTMNYSSCQLARVATIHSAVPGTYTVTDTFVDESTPNGPSATVTFTVTVT